MITTSRPKKGVRPIITRIEEKWIAKGNFPDYEVVFTAESKEELAELIIRNMEAHRIVFETHKSEDVKSYCILCLKELIKMADQLEEYPAN